MLAIEQHDLFNMLIEKKAHEFYKVILVYTGEGSSHLPRRLVEHLHVELGMPVYPIKGQIDLASRLGIPA